MKVNSKNSTKDAEHYFQHNALPNNRLSFSTVLHSMNIVNVARTMENGDQAETPKHFLVFKEMYIYNLP